MSYCRDPDCIEEASVDDLCDTHYRRKLRGRSVSGPISQRPTSPRNRLREAAIRYGDASDMDDDEYQRADDNLAKSAVAFTFSQERYARLMPMLNLRGHHNPARRRRAVNRWMQLELRLDQSK